MTCSSFQAFRRKPNTFSISGLSSSFLQKQPSSLPSSQPFLLLLFCCRFLRSLFLSSSYFPRNNFSALKALLVLVSVRINNRLPAPKICAYLIDDNKAVLGLKQGSYLRPDIIF